MRKIILVFFTLFISLQIYAQCIQGTIKDLHGNPIAFATVYVPEISKGTTSNIEGNYTLDLPKGEHIIIIRYLGYKTREITVNCAGETQELNIVLQEQAYKIPEVRILVGGQGRSLKTQLFHIVKRQTI